MSRQSCLQMNLHVAQVNERATQRVTRYGSPRVETREIEQLYAAAETQSGRIGDLSLRVALSSPAPCMLRSPPCDCSDGPDSTACVAPRPAGAVDAIDSAGPEPPKQSTDSQVPTDGGTCSHSHGDVRRGEVIGMRKRRARSGTSGATREWLHERDLRNVTGRGDPGCSN